MLAKQLAGHPTKHTISSNPEEPGELLSSSELEARRPDGFKFIIAPVLRGEGNWPSISLYGTMEQRIHFTVDALLARIPFWFKVCLSYVFFWFCMRQGMVVVVLTSRGAARYLHTIHVRHSFMLGRSQLLGRSAG